MRRFDGPLTAGQRFSIDLDNGSPAGGDTGIFWQNPSGQRQIGFYANTSAYYFLYDNSGAATSIPRTTTGVHLELTLPTATTYSLAVTPLVGGSTTTFTGTIPKAGGIDRAHFGHFRTGLLETNRTYFNNMEILDPGVVFRETFSSVASQGTSSNGTATPVTYAGRSFTFRNSSGFAATASTTVTGELNLNDFAKTYSDDYGVQSFTTSLSNLGREVLVEGDLGIDSAVGNATVGLRVGNLAFTFFPGPQGTPGVDQGAFRINQVLASGDFGGLVGSTDMGFFPGTGVLHHMAVAVTPAELPDQWQFDVSVQSANSPSQQFHYRYVTAVSNFDPFGPVDVGFVGSEMGQTAVGAPYTRRFDNLTVTSLPEPASLVLVGVGLALLPLMRRRVAAR